MDETLEAALRLHTSGLSARKQTVLVKGLGSAEAVFGAPEEALLQCCPSLTQADLGALTAAAHRDVGDTAARLEGLEVSLLCFGSEPYPRLLAQIDDPPPALYLRGEVRKSDELAVAIVGTRQCTAYGETVAQELAASLARRGFTVVSGLAVGIDAAAHRGALRAGGRTIGVMACGIDIDYPKSNAELREEMVESGAVVSEMPLGTTPRREIFPQRNRIVSGLGLGTVVVEAPARSGALITANLALDQGREVFAVPGDINSANSHGCHALIKDGAHLVESTEDVVAGLGILVHAVPERRPVMEAQADLSGDEQVVLSGLSTGPRRLDQLVAASRIPASRVSAALMLLEVKQVIRRLEGGSYARLV
jgi:DNA processing protein